MTASSHATAVGSSAASEPTDVAAFLAAHADEYAFYGSGKAALRDGLAGLARPGENVLLPAYLPDAVAEPLAELGLEARYYAVDADLAPDLADLERRIDGETAAILTVDYFGLPAPSLDAVASIAGEHGCYHIDDAAHAALSVDDGTLLGTHGHLGITSLWKTLPVPNGAVLYLTDDDVAERYRPTPLAGTDDRVDADDWRFVLASFATDLLGGSATVERAVDTLAADQPDPGPAARYEAAKTRMSALAARVVATVDPDEVRTARRAAYRDWGRLVEEAPGVDPVYPFLPAGICPQSFPVRADRPWRLVAALERDGVDAHTWPRLPAAVHDRSEYDTARRLAREIVVLPVDRRLEPSELEAIGRSLRR